MEPFSRRLTPTEVSVVVATLVGLLVLLSTSVVASRENARANYCRKNLRRLDEAVAEHREYHSRFPHPASWPLELLGPLENGPIRRPELNAFRQRRPNYLTCPSQPVMAANDAFYQQNHYVAVIENRDSPDENWRFRDRDVEDLSDSSGHWCIGVSLAASDPRQLKPRGGPHADASFLLSDGRGNVTILQAAE